MFNPSREQARQLLFGTWAKYRAGTPMAGLETHVIDIILLHPEYHELLGNPSESAQLEYTPETGQMNPFLHLSLHLAIEEQLSIDQPPGVLAEFQRILARTADRHEALHSILECLGDMIWRAQRDSMPADGEAYLDCIRRCA